MKNKGRLAGLGLSIFLGMAVLPTQAAIIESPTEEVVSIQSIGDIPITTTNFPDAVFRQYILEKIDKDSNGSLSNSEIATCKKISVASKGISSLKGVEYFYALTGLSCYSNQLTSLNISQNTALTELRCGNNQLTSLNVSNQTALTYLSCYENQISILDVSQNPALAELRCGDNQLKSLDVSKNTQLTVLSCFGNQLGSLDLGQNFQISELLCNDNVVTCSGTQLDMLQYDRNFQAGRVSALSGLELLGNVLALQTGKTSGSYTYNCGQGKTMMVTVRQASAGTGTDTGNNSFFADIDQVPGHWKYESAKYVYEQGIMGGVGGSNLFQPDYTLTRAMFATVLYRMAGEPSVAYNNRFSDVEPNKWYSSAILWANTKGIVNGYIDGRYGIDDNITREQIAKMLYLFGETQGYNVNGRATLDSFTDTAQVSSWAVGYLQWAVDAGMISGKPDAYGSFYLDPKGQATRAECAKMLMMFQQKYKTT